MLIYHIPKCIRFIIEYEQINFLLPKFLEKFQFYINFFSKSYSPTPYCKINVSPLLTIVCSAAKQINLCILIPVMDGFQQIIFFLFSQPHAVKLRNN